MPLASLGGPVLPRSRGVVRWASVLVWASTMPAWSQTTFNQIALTGELAPGAADGAEFDAFTGFPVINASGDVAFAADLRTGSSGTEVTFNNDEAIFGPVSGAGSPLGIVARDDALAPGVSDGAEFSNFGSFAINASGDVAFAAFLRTGPGGSAVTFDNNQAIFGPVSGAGSSLGVIARTNDLAPGVADGSEFSFVGAPALNAAGDVAFSANLRAGPGGTAVTGGNNGAVFGPVSGVGSSLGVIARTDSLAPGVSDGAEFLSLIHISEPTRPY